MVEIRNAELKTPVSHAAVSAIAVVCECQTGNQFRISLRVGSNDQRQKRATQNDTLIGDSSYQLMEHNILYPFSSVSVSHPYQLTGHKILHLFSCISVSHPCCQQGFLPLTHGIDKECRIERHLSVTPPSPISV